MATVMLSSETIRIFHSIKHESNRPIWKYKDLTISQITVLAKYVKLTDLIILDRGSASILLDCIFTLKNTDGIVSDFTMIEEITKIVNADKI